LLNITINTQKDKPVQAKLAQKKRSLFQAKLVQVLYIKQNNVSSSSVLK